MFRADQHADSRRRMAESTARAMQELWHCAIAHFHWRVLGHLARMPEGCDCYNLRRTGGLWHEHTLRALAAPIADRGRSVASTTRFRFSAGPARSVGSTWLRTALLRGALRTSSCGSPPRWRGGTSKSTKASRTSPPPSRSLSWPAPPPSLPTTRNWPESLEAATHRTPAPLPTRTFHPPPHEAPRRHACSPRVRRPDSAGKQTRTEQSAAILAQADLGASAALGRR